MTRAFLCGVAMVVLAGCAPLPSAGTPTGAASATPQPSLGCHAADGGFLPDSTCTPGAADPRVTQANVASTICRTGYTATVRPPASLTEPIKRDRMAADGIAAPLADYELDHLIPLGLGGSTTVANLWPEPRSGARGAPRKDALEGAVRDQVCTGAVSLAVAQLAISANWERAYQTFVGSLPSAAPATALLLPLWLVSPQPASSSRTVRAAPVIRPPEARCADSATPASPPIQVAT